jgi:predicted enzyme related to lactoylglutathione lyase
VMQDSSGGQLGGIFDATDVLPEGTPDHWSVFWVTPDLGAAIGRATAAGGSAGPTQDSPYGSVAEISDPTGATFVLHQAKW